MGFVLPESFIFPALVDSSPVNWESWFLKKTFTWLWNGLSAMYSKYTTVCMTNFRQKRIREYRRDPVIASSLYIHSIHKDCQLPHTRLILVLSECCCARGYPATHSSRTITGTRAYLQESVRNRKNYDSTPTAPFTFQILFMKDIFLVFKFQHGNVLKY